MKKIIFLRGLPASGKSTYAKELVLKSPGKYKRINKDDLRAMVDVGKRSKANEKFIIDTRDAMIGMALGNNYSVIVDDTNFAPSHAESLQKIAEENGAIFEVKFFDTPVDECIERDSKRENPVGKKVIMEMYNKYLYKPWVRKPYINNNNLCIICDIDGTIAEKGDRDIYDFSKCGLDKPILETLAVLSSFYVNLTQGGGKVEIIITTGRMEYCRAETEKWLKDNGIGFHKLYMRATDDTRKDSIVKQEIYDKYIKDKYDVLCVFDDRPQVVKMWRDNGLFVFDVNQSGKDF